MLRRWDTRCLAPLYLAFPAPPVLVSLLWARVQARQSPCVGGEACESSIEMLLSLSAMFGKFRLPPTDPASPTAGLTSFSSSASSTGASSTASGSSSSLHKSMQVPSSTIYSYHVQRMWRRVIPWFMMVHDPRKEGGGATYRSTTNSHFSWVPLWTLGHRFSFIGLLIPQGCLRQRLLMSLGLKHMIPPVQRESHWQSLNFLARSPSISPLTCAQEPQFGIPFESIEKSLKTQSYWLKALFLQSYNVQPESKVVNPPCLRLRR